MKRPLRWMYLTYRHNETRNKEQTKALIAIAKYFDGIIMAVPPRFEAPDLRLHAVGDAIKRAKDYGLSVGILQRPWPSWKGSMVRACRSMFDRLTNPDIMEDALNWAAAIAHVKNEALILGVDSGLYCETEAARLRRFKAAPMDDSQRARIRAAIEAATSIEGRVKFMLPLGASDPLSYMYAFTDVAGMAVNGGTYKRSRGNYRDKTPLERRVAAVLPVFWAVASTTHQPIYWTPATIREWEIKAWTDYVKEHKEATGYGVYWTHRVGPLASMFARLR